MARAADLKEIHLKQGDTLLGTLKLDHLDFPWVNCTFEPTPDFEDVSLLFEKELELLNAQAMDTWGDAYDKILALGLRLIDTVSGRDLGDFLLHIDGNKAWFRC